MQLNLLNPKDRFSYTYGLINKQRTFFIKIDRIKTHVLHEGKKHLEREHFY